MSIQQPEKHPEGGEPDESAVADYLLRHPEFFRRRRDVLAGLDIPHDVSPAVSLIEYQVAVLREECGSLRGRLEELLRVARDNDRLAEQLHRFTLELLAADGLDAVLVALRDGLRTDFRADVVEVVLVGRDLPAVDVPVLDPADAAVSRLREAFRGDRPVVGRLSEEQLGAAFGEQAQGLRSAAVVPLDEPPVSGVVAIGSRDPERYRGDHGTVFLGQLGAIIGRVLQQAMPR